MGSDILKRKLKTFLTEVCDFTKDQKWKLIYKGSIDGFSPTNFHSRCDLIEKTITIIESRSGQIFGGYTDKAWSSVEGYVNDYNAFLFELVNCINQPLKIKSCDPKHAIFNDANSGPIFGKTKKGKADLSVKLHSNSLFFRSFSAGSSTFNINDIEVFCKI